MPKSPTNLEIGQPVPQDEQIERLVLGCCLVREKAIEPAADLLEPGDFFHRRHSKLWKLIREMHEDGRAVDIVSVCVRLREEGLLDECGPEAYIAGLVDGIPRVDHVRDYASQVKALSIRRRTIYALEAAREAAFSESPTAADIVEGLLDRLSELKAEALDLDSPTRSPFIASTNLLHELQQGEPLAVRSGLEVIDRTCGGFRPGELVLLTAATGVGKTILAQQIRRFTCRTGHHSLYCSGEMSAEHLVSRELAPAAAVPLWKMRKANEIETSEFDRLVQAASRQCNTCQILDGELTLARIRRAARRMARTSGLAAIIWDYDELIESPGSHENDQQRNLIRAAKSLAIELGCVSIMVSQLRKSPSREEAAVPTIERIYGSGAKTKHASIVIYVDREYVRELTPGTETNAKIVILKNRDGKIGSKNIRFDVGTLEFRDYPETV